MKQFVWIVVAIAAVPVLVGCAPPGLCAGVQYAADTYASRDASALRVKGHPYYRFDAHLHSDLDDAIRFPDLEAAKREGGNVLAAAQALAVEVTGGEIDRMAPEGIAFLTKRYGQGNSTGTMEEQRRILKDRYSENSRAALQADLAHLLAAHDVRRVRRLLRNIEVGIEAPAGDRGKLGRALLAAPLFLPAAIGAEIADAKATQQVLDADFDHVFVYRPEHADRAQTAAQLASADDHQLAQWYAPVFIQQHDPEASYPAGDDQFGEVQLTGTPDEINVRIDVERPTVYWTRQEGKFGMGRREPSDFDHHDRDDRLISSIGSQTRKQIVYVAWYPRRPALKSGDSEAGLIDGVVIRMTLDRLNRPAIYEFVRSCGCYHMLYVAEFLESAARRHFGGPMPGEEYAIQKGGAKVELFIPALVPDDGSHPARPIAYVSGGQHMLMGVEAGGVWKGGADVMAHRTYRLEKYETLTRLPLGNGVASMFGSDGLVHNAGRAEGWLLAPTGMRSAGQPRQLGTMKIRMDAYDYDDPYLLDRQLRLPPDF